MFLIDAHARHILMLLFAAIACWTDLNERRIPNWLTAIAAASGCVLFYLNGGIGLKAGLGNSLAGLVCSGGVFLLLYMFGGFGGGDVKLMGSLGSLTGFPACIRLIMYVAVSGGVIALAILLYHRAFFEGLKASGRILLGRRPQLGEPPTDNENGEKAPESAIPRTIPYGLAVLMGVCWFYLEGGS